MIKHIVRLLLTLVLFTLGIFLCVAMLKVLLVVLEHWLVT